MVPFRRRYVLSVVGLILMLLASFGIAYALNIIVDGNPSDWGSTAPLIVDPQEVNIPANVNFSAGYATVNRTGPTSADLFWRFDTYSDTRYTPVGPFSPFVLICMDIVGNPGPGALIPQCNATGHFEHLLRIDGSTSGIPSATLYDCTSGTCSIQATAVVSVAHQFTVTEASLRFADVGLSVPCTQTQMINVAFYFDNQDLPPDDTMPNTGTTQYTMGCTPTAIELSSVTAKSPDGMLPMMMVLVGIVGVSVAGVVVLRRRHR